MAYETTSPWLSGYPGVREATYGSVSVAKEDVGVILSDKGLLYHEGVHVRQWRRFGIAFPVDYFSEELVEGGPEHNGYEIEANRDCGHYDGGDGICNH